MLVCDRCKKLARLYAFGDFINESYEYLDLCYDCAARLRGLILHYKHGDDVVWINPPKSDYSEEA